MIKNKKIIKKLPLLITNGVYFLPETITKTKCKTLSDIKFFKYILKNKIKKEILIVSLKDNKDNKIKKLDNIHHFGVLANFSFDKLKLKENELIIQISSLKRIKIFNFKEDKKEGIYFSDYEVLKDKKLTETQRKELSRSFLNKIEFFNKKLYENIKNKTFTVLEIKDFIYSVLNNLPTSRNHLKQKSLEIDSIIERYNLLEGFRNFEKKLNLEKIKEIIDNEINEIIKKKLSDQQRKFLLKEKLKIIKEQLENFETKNKTISIYLKRLLNEPFPKKIKERMEEEISRLQSLHPTSGEAGVLKNYIDWVMSLPWYQKTTNNNDFKKVREILDLNHYGLKKPKEAIIEHLASNIFSKKNVGQILCLIGPPGVGKTSLGLSIANALGKKYVRISLGGIKDESEIRGHRKTYIGAMPGKIIRALKQAGTKNPLILIDEIDKLSSDYRGDPSSAMLEVLDPEQNSTFTDNYIEEPFDLSSVTFVATANYQYWIPSALRDRMELIYLSSYTELEKFEITKKHLISKIFKELNLNKSQLEFFDSGIIEIIKYYTREAGVRELSRLIKKICRKVIVKLLINKKQKKINITNKNISKYLDVRIFEHTLKNKKSEIGVVTGLAYTQYGGDILPIETTKFSGSGKLILTGKLGEIMRESANVALNFIKSNSKKFKINSKEFNKNDIHIHVPEGAVPKDGPSAGVTLTTALISLFKNKVVDNKIGMTGEITLTGKVLPIGGLKEKSISAVRSNLEIIFIPKENEKDLKEIPEEIKEKLEIIFISKYSEIYNKLFKNN